MPRTVESRISPKEVEYLKKEFRVKLLVDPRISKELNDWLDSKEGTALSGDEALFIEHVKNYKLRDKMQVTKQTSDMLSNVRRLDKKKDKDAYEYYAKIIGEDGVEYHNNITDSKEPYHYRNNIKDVSNIIYEFLKLNKEDQEKMPALRDYVRSRACFFTFSGS